MNDRLYYYGLIVISMMIIVGSVLLVIGSLNVNEKDITKIKITKCYDGHNNEIIGQDCKMEYTEYPIIVLMGMSIIIISLFILMLWSVI